MSASTKSRSQLDIGTVFFYRLFDGRDGPKDRYFLVVATNSTCFLSFTTTTQQYLLERYPTEVTPIIKAGTTCLPKDCIVDCRFLHDFDDIQMSSYLGSGRVSVIGDLPDSVLQVVKDATASSKMLERRKKKHVLDSLASVLDKPVE